MKNNKIMETKNRKNKKNRANRQTRNNTRNCAIQPYSQAVSQTGTLLVEVSFQRLESERTEIPKELIQIVSREAHKLNGLVRELDTTTQMRLRTYPAQRVSCMLDQTKSLLDVLERSLLPRLR